MPDREKVVKGLTELKKYLPSTMWEPISDAIELLKEQEHLLMEYEKLSKVLFKIEKYFKISDLSSIVDGIENGTIVVLQDNGHYIGGTPITETTIKIRRM